MRETQKTALARFTFFAFMLCLDLAAIASTWSDGSTGLGVWLGSALLLFIILAAMSWSDVR